MKKIFIPLMAIVLTATAFTSCEDVPAPYSINYDESGTSGGGTNTETGTPSGTGTEADPFNVAAANNYITAGVNLDQAVYVTGTIVSVKEIDNTTYGNATYYISDDGTTAGQLTVYRGYALGNKKFTKTDEIKAGDKVVIYGKLINFNGTKEFTQGNYIYSLNGAKGTSATPAPAADLNTAATAWTPEEAVAKIKSEADSILDGEAFVKGKISKVVSYNSTYKSINYYISTNGTDQTLYVFSGKGLDGADFTAVDNLQVGQEVVVKGILKAYKDKSGNVVYEFDKSNKIISISGATTPTPTPNPGTGEVPAGANLVVNTTDMGFTDRVAATTWTAKDGAVFTFDKGEGTMSPTYYAGTYPAVRMYAKTNMTIVATKAISKIIITCSTPSGSKKYNGNDIAYAEGDVKVNVTQESDTVISFSGLNSKTVKVVNDFTSSSKGVHLYVASIEIIYAN